MKGNRQDRSCHERKLRHRINAGRVAVREQIPFFSRQFGQVASDWKEDDTRVTFADFAISERIFAALRRDFSEDDYCSEEANPLDETMALEASFAWVIDPVDGTNNFALGFPMCAISLALLYEGRPVYGFVYDHSRGVLYEGGPGYGLLCEGKKTDRSRRSGEEQIMLGLEFPMPAEGSDRLKPLTRKYRCRSIGSGTLTATYVATGYLSGSVSHRVKVWDIAAAYALCLGSGVCFEFVDTSPFPLKTFHPRMKGCPYYAGNEAVFRELKDRLV